MFDDVPHGDDVILSLRGRVLSKRVLMDGHSEPTGVTRRPPGKLEAFGTKASGSRDIQEVAAIGPHVEQRPPSGRPEGSEGFAKSAVAVVLLRDIKRVLDLAIGLEQLGRASKRPLEQQPTGLAAPNGWVVSMTEAGAVVRLGRHVVFAHLPAKLLHQPVIA